VPRAASRDPIYYRRRYTPEVIELCVRWYVTNRLSYRDLAAMMAERSVAVSHTTIMRWVQRYVPEFERRWARSQGLPVRPGGWTRPPPGPGTRPHGNSLPWVSILAVSERRCVKSRPPSSNPAAAIAGVESRYDS
jgi:hypothetical protein